MSDVLRFDLAKDPKGNPITYGRVGDSDGLTRRVKVFEDGKPLDLTGWTTTFEGNTSNWKTKVFDTEGISIIDPVKGEFSYTFPNKAFAVEGQYERAYFSFMKGDQRKSTGNFEIIVLGDSDIDAPEAETIITEYNKLVAELNELQNQAIDEMNRNFSEAQGRISELEVQINDLRNKIDQALTDFETGNFWTKEESFNKEESSANVVYQIIGKEKVQITFRTDFTDKIAGTDERIHRAWIKEYATVTAPSEWLAKIPDNQMGKIESLDNDAYTIAGATNLNICQIGQEYNLVIVLTQLLGEQFFIDRGATSPSQKVEVIRSIIKNIESSVWGSGSGVGGYKLTMNRASNINGLFSSWIQGGSHQNSTYSKVSATLQTAGQFETAINPNGWFRQVVYANKSDGTTKSQVFMDYACMDITIEISANEHIKSTIAAYSGENINKNFVGLGNVDNYSTANQLESEAGTATNKFVTPKGVAAYVDSINKVAEYKITNKSQIPDANAAEWVDELEAVFKRRGDRVDFFCRINFNKSTGTYTPGYFRLPQGFRLSTEFNNFIWNVPLAITKYVNADEFRGVAFAERQSSGGNYIRIGNKVTGNHWVSGTWYTDDPFPSVAGS